MSPVVQSSYSERISPAVAGMVASQRADDNITRICEEVNGIGFGLAVARGSVDAEKGCVLGGTLVNFLGVSKRDVTLESSQSDKYNNTQNVGIQTHGEIWVQVSVVIATTDAVHYNATTGIFTNTGGSGPILGARWMSESVNGLAKLFLPAYGQAAA